MLKILRNECNGIVFFLLVYGLWWGYAIHFLYWKDYEDNPNGAWAAMAIASITLVVMLIYLIGFVVAAIRNRKNRNGYLLAIPLLFIPLLAVTVFEYLKSK